VFGGATRSGPTNTIITCFKKKKKKKTKWKLQERKFRNAKSLKVLTGAGHFTIRINLKHRIEKLCHDFWIIATIPNCRSKDREWVPRIFANRDKFDSFLSIRKPSLLEKPAN